MLDKVGKTYRVNWELLRTHFTPSKGWGRKRGIGEWRQHFFRQIWQTLPIIGNGRVWWEELQRLLDNSCVSRRSGRMAGLGSWILGSNHKDLHPLESYFKYATCVSWVLWEVGAELESEEQIIYCGRRTFLWRMMWGRSSIGQGKPETTCKPDAVLGSQWEAPTEGYLLGGPILGTDGLALGPLSP